MYLHYKFYSVSSIDFDFLLCDAMRFSFFFFWFSFSFAFTFFTFWHFRRRHRCRRHRETFPTKRYKTKFTWHFLKFYDQMQHTRRHMSNEHWACYATTMSMPATDLNPIVSCLYFLSANYSSTSCSSYFGRGEREWTDSGGGGERWTKCSSTHMKSEMLQ